MALEKQPRSLIVIGGRALALELGQTFARFGTAVMLLQRSPRISPDHEHVNPFVPALQPQIVPRLHTPHSRT